MYYQSETRNAATLPRATMANLIVDSNAKITTATNYNNNKKTVNNIENDDNDIIKELRRPTYGAYTYNSLPRGPYLQYKFNDQQQSIRYVSENDNNDHQKQHQQNQQNQFHQKSKQYHHNPPDYSLNKVDDINRGNGAIVARAQLANCISMTDQYPIYPKFHGNQNNEATTTHRVHPSNVNTQGTKVNQYHSISSSSSSSNVNQNCQETNIQHGLYPTHTQRLKVSHQQHKHPPLYHRDNPNRICYSNDPEIKLNHSKPLMQNFSGTSDFLKQIQQKNSNLVARMAAAASQTQTLRQTSSGYPYTNYNDTGNTKFILQNSKSLSEFGRSMNNSSPGSSSSGASSSGSSSNQVNFVTLSDVIRMKPEGLNQYEGWALLCQSVQALQDLFLADTPSTTRILPLVRPSTVQITSRGRVVFSISAINQLDKITDANAYFDITSHLSPEYLYGMGKKMTYAESDIEKMWIYSLGITLRSTVKKPKLAEDLITTTVKSTIDPYLRTSNHEKPTYSHIRYHSEIIGSTMPHHKSNPLLNRSSDITLDQVIACMCEHNLHQRASLMYLLDLNTERNVLRRPPDAIASLRPKFDENKFNFNKIKPQEKILEVEFNDFIVTLIVNQSPLTKYHTLICPRVSANLPQILTRDAIDFALCFMKYLRDPLYRIGYNSPGALASVNHLHLHLIYLERDLVVDTAVISSFCRSQHQVKPFSHIVMELFKDVVTSLQIQQEELKKIHKNNLKTQQSVLSRDKSSDGSRSESDSGRSSTYGDKESNDGNYAVIDRLIPNDIPERENPKITVYRDKPVQDIGYKKYNTIGYADVKPLLHTNENQTNQLHVVRRRHNAHHLKKRNSTRRNTIDVNLNDLEKARQNNFLETESDLNVSKSTNFIDKITECSDFEKKVDAIKLFDGVSMPNLDRNKVGPYGNLKVRRDRIRNDEILKKSYSEESFLAKPSGPEFILKSSLPSKEIDLIDSKCQHRRIVSVLLLDGQSLHVGCNSITTTAGQVFEAVVKSEYYSENFFIGLCALIGGDFVFLPSDLKIYKVAPQIWVSTSKKLNVIDSVYFTLFLRIKFFLPTLRGISSLESRHMLYLQLRKSILEKHILCNDDDMITLGGLALQAEIGDFKESMKYVEYFTISHYLPEGVYHRNKEMAKYLRNSHYSRHGLHPKEAEQNFIKYIQEMKEYGYHLYSAVWTPDDRSTLDVYVGISLSGIAIFERSRQSEANITANSKISYQRKLYSIFEWLEIENLCFSKHNLCIVVRKTESLKAKDNNRIKYKLRMDGRKSYFAFSLASQHHQFYMKLRNSFISLKTLSDELNIPITSGILDDKVSMIGSYAVDPDKESSALPTSEKLEEAKAADNAKKPDKQGKGSGLRVRNLKKSMLNDNRLLKLKQKFLRRSKSTVGIYESKHDKEEQNSKQPKDNNIDSSKEENQNKENECPKIYLNDISPKLCSPNRNRVKMGTRVFSSQFLNKSYENIYDRTLNVCRFESANSIDNEAICDTKINVRAVSERPSGSSHDENRSFRSTSLSSIYGVCPEKIFNGRNDPPKEQEAYVIHSSIKSERDIFNNFTLTNETISESLLEKFHNMSGNNAVNDRIIRKISIIKECLNKYINEKDNLTKKRDHIKYATFSQRTAKELVVPIPDVRYDTKIMDERSLLKRTERLGSFSRSQESIFINNKFTMKNEPINQQQNAGNDLNGFTLGISIVQGTDNNVYVKDLVKNGPGEKSGVRVGDQIIAVNGISLLNLSYNESLKILQNTGLVVDLVVSQIYGGKTKNTNVKMNTTSRKSVQDLFTSTLLNEDFAKLLDSKNCGSKVNKTEGLLEKSLMQDAVERNFDLTLKNQDDYLQHIRFETNDLSYSHENEQKDILGIDGKMDYSPSKSHALKLWGHTNHDHKIRSFEDKFKSPLNVRGNLFALSPAKSMPDLPKVVAIIPKQPSSKELLNDNEKHKLAVRSSTTHCRKYLGPVRYPVTPIKTILSPGKHQLSLLADSDDEQICFHSSNFQLLVKPHLLVRSAAA